jgi:hypothetical protein
MDREDKRRSATLDRAGRRGYDDYHEDYSDDKQVAVVAGTAADANRVAYVKTVRPTSPAEQQQQQEVAPPMSVDNTNGPNTNEAYRYTIDDLSPLSTDVSHSQISADGIPKKRKKKKRVANGSRQTSERTSNTEDEMTYRTERSGVVETRVERRLVIDGQDVDYDYELSKAITNVTNMDANLSVEKIEINPSDVAKSMTGAAADEARIEIAPIAKVKKTTKKKSTTRREKVAELA